MVSLVKEGVQAVWKDRAFLWIWYQLLLSITAHLILEKSFHLESPVAQDIQVFKV